jgi:two-component system cell cycle response regulator DivK
MKKVLVVEDNRDNLRLITYALQREGYEVVSAETGERGVEIAIRERPIFIVMDINLPGIDGLETIQRIRESEADGNIPIAALTSYTMEGDRQRIMAAGCNAYFEKPIDPLTIVEKIEKALGIRRE